MSGRINEDRYESCWWLVIWRPGHRHIIWKACNLLIFGPWSDAEGVYIFLRWYLVPGKLLICSSPVVASCPIKINKLDFLVIVKQDVWGAQIAIYNPVSCILV